MSQAYCMPVHVTDFIAVKRRNGDLDDFLKFAHTNWMMMSVSKWKLFEVPIERNAGQSLRRVEPITAVKFTECGVEHAVLKRGHHLLEETIGTHKALISTSCTHALEMCGVLLEIGPGDEVIVPSFTFVSTASAFALRGARIVFGDVRSDTMNLDHERLLALITAHCEQTYHMVYLLMPSLEERQAFFAHLRRPDVLAILHYNPLHLSEFGARYGAGAGSCPATEDVSDRLVRLPLFNDLSEPEQERVIDAIEEFRFSSKLA